MKMMYHHELRQKHGITSDFAVLSSMIYGHYADYAVIIEHENVQHM